MNDYIGDGVYVEWDGYQVKLWTPRAGGDHEIYLEPEVVQNLLKFLERVKNQPKEN